MEQNGARPDGSAYAENTPLTAVFGNNARVKIIAAMLSEREHDLNVTDIAALAGIARSTVYDHMDALEETHIVVHTRDVGDSPMYQINNDNPIVERIDEIEGLALREQIEE